MAAYDRTLLANLGFADRDRGNPLHDQACARLLETPVAERLLDLSSPGWLEKMGKTPRLTRTFLEVPVSKGENQYKTTIGFLDALVDARSENGPLIRESDNTFSGTNGGRVRVGVEVKAGDVQWSAVLRQVLLYLEYTQCNDHLRVDAFVVLVMFPIMDSWAAPLRSQGLIVLGRQDLGI